MRSRRARRRCTTSSSRSWEAIRSWHPGWARRSSSTTRRASSWPGSATCTPRPPRGSGDAPAALLDPKDGVRHWEKVQNAINLRAQGKVARGAADPRGIDRRGARRHLRAQRAGRRLRAARRGREGAARFCSRRSRRSPTTIRCSSRSPGAYLSRGRIDEAEAAIARALEIDPESPERVIQQGQIALMRGREQEAMALFERAIALDPGSTGPLGWNRIGFLHLRAHRLDEARAAFESAIEIDRLNASARDGLANVLLAEDKLDEAAKMLALALRFDPNQPRALATLASLASRRESTSARWRSRSAGSSSRPKEGELHNAIGLVYRRMGDYERARESYQKAIEYGPYLDKPHVNLAQLHLREGRDEEATEEFRAALRVNPWSPDRARQSRRPAVQRRATWTMRCACTSARCTWTRTTRSSTATWARSISCEIAPTSRWSICAAASSSIRASRRRRRCATGSPRRRSARQQRRREATAGAAAARRRRGIVRGSALARSRTGHRARARLPRGGPEPWSLLLVTLDTTRADHLGAYGYPHVDTPTLDGWAEAGVRFERAITPAPLTLPSHASLMTGLLPPRHGVHVNGEDGAVAGRGDAGRAAARRRLCDRRGGRSVRARRALRPRAGLRPLRRRSRGERRAAEPLRLPPTRRRGGHRRRARVPGRCAAAVLPVGALLRSARAVRAARAARRRGADRCARPTTPRSATWTPSSRAWPSISRAVVPARTR